MKVLVIDDSSTMRMIITKAIRQAGYESATVLEASGAKEALQKVAAGGIDLVLCDVNMPDITGIELVKVVRTKFPKLPIVMVTTESSPEMREKMLTAGANDIVTKPFAPAQLRAAIDPLLKAE